MNLKSAAYRVLQRNKVRNLVATSVGILRNSRTTPVTDSLISMDQEEQLLKALSSACLNLGISPVEAFRALDIGTLESWQHNEIGDEMLQTFCLAVDIRRNIDQGVRPTQYNKPAYCQGCGPVWLWISGTVTGCPWCWNRATGRPIPRPCMVRCQDCKNFDRIEHPHLGHCSRGQPENIAGLWDEDLRYCEHFLPKPVSASDGQAKPERAK